jgi:hypothetical protein
MFEPLRGRQSRPTRIVVTPIILIGLAGTALRGRTAAPDCGCGNPPVRPNGGNAE